MAIAFHVSGTAATGTTALVVTIPATASVGDLLVMSVSCASSAAAAATATGWTQLDTATDSGSSPFSNITVLWRACVGGDPGATVTLTFGNTTTTTVGVVNAYSGTDTVTPFESHAANFDATAGATTHTTSSITFAGSNEWVLASFADRSGSTWTPPSTYTERTDNASGAAASIETTDSNGVIAATTLSLTATGTTSTSNAAMWIGALKAAAASGDTFGPGWTGAGGWQGSGWW